MPTRYDYITAIKITKVDNHIVAYQQNSSNSAVVVNKLNTIEVRKRISEGLTEGEYEYHGSDTLSWMIWDEDKMNVMIKNHPNEVFREEEVPNYS